MENAAIPADIIRVDLIPKSVGETIGQVALDGFLKYKRYMEAHPEEKRAFLAKTVEVKKHYGI